MQSKTMLCCYLSGPRKRRKEARVRVGWFGHCGACLNPSSAGTAGAYQLQDNKEEFAALQSLSLPCSGSFMLPFSVSYKFLLGARDKQGNITVHFFIFQNENCTTLRRLRSLSFRFRKTSQRRMTRSQDVDNGNGEDGDGGGGSADDAGNSSSADTLQAILARLTAMNEIIEVIGKRVAALETGDAARSHVEQSSAHRIAPSSASRPTIFARLEDPKSGTMYR